VNFLLAIRAYRSAAEEFCDAIGRFGRIDTPYELNPDFDLDLINRAQAIA